MKKGSFFRQIKRKAMREHGSTFTARVTEAVRVGSAVRNVNFNFDRKGSGAAGKPAK